MTMNKDVNPNKPEHLVRTLHATLLAIRSLLLSGLSKKDVRMEIETSIKDLEGVGYLDDSEKLFKVPVKPSAAVDAAGASDYEIVDGGVE